MTAWTIFIAVSLRFVGIVGGIIALLNIIGVQLYELQALKQHRQRRLHPHRRRYAQRPLLSVVIPTSNDEAVIGRCLDSVLASSYRKVEIIIADMASRDGTKQYVKQYMARYPKRRIKLLARRTVGRRLEAAAAACRSYGTGDLLLVLDPALMLDRSALSRAVEHFNSDAAIDVLTPKERVAAAFSSLGVLQAYQELLSHRAKKSISALKVDYAVGDPAFYRRTAFLALAVAPRRRGHIYYASDVVVRTAPPLSLQVLLIQQYTNWLGRWRTLYSHYGLFFSTGTRNSVWLTWLGLPFAVVAFISAALAPVLLAYFAYVALVLHQPALLLASFGLLTVFLIWSIWGDEQLRFYQKIGYSLGLPLSYGWLLLLSCLPLVVLLTPARTREI